jgi:hypothetical protein
MMVSVKIKIIFTSTPGCLAAEGSLREENNDVMERHNGGKNEFRRI